MTSLPVSLLTPAALAAARSTPSFPLSFPTSVSTWPALFFHTKLHVGLDGLLGAKLGYQIDRVNMA